jgi:hypothetical protein
MGGKSPWEVESGVQVLRLYRSKTHGDWGQDVNKKDLWPDWPQIVVLNLSSTQFDEFQQDHLAFAKKYNLYDQPIKLISHCAMPPMGEGIPRATPLSSYTVVFIHTSDSSVVCEACPQR